MPAAGGLHACAAAHVLHPLLACLPAPQVTVTDVKGNKRDILKGVDGYVEPNHMMVGGPAGGAGGGVASGGKSS